MSKSKEYVSTSTDDSEEDKKPKKKQKHVSDDEGEKSKPSKKTKKGPSEKEDNVWDLGNNRKVTVREYKGKLYVDIREMYYDGEGNLKPGKKGISMTTAQWRSLLSIMDEVDKCVKSKA